MSQEEHGPGGGRLGVGDGLPVEIGQFGRVCGWVGSDPHEIERVDARVEGGAYVPVEGADGLHVGVEWEAPRHVHRVVVEYRSPEDVPGEREVFLQYWHNVWPAENRGHWTPVDDAWNGKWVTAHATARREGALVSYAFDPLDITELPRATDFAVRYRKSLKIRFLARAGRLAVRRFRIYSDAVWRSVDVEIRPLGGSELRGGPAGEGLAGVRLLAHNGFVDRVERGNEAVWARIWYASDPGGGEATQAGTYPDHAYSGRWPYDGGFPDRTVVTVSGLAFDFGFLPGDVARGRSIVLPDAGVEIARAGAGTAAPRTADGAGAAASVRRTIYDRVEREPEQSYERAAREMPALAKTRQEPWGRYVCLGCDANRQEFALTYNGHVHLNKYELKVNRRDTARLLWPGIEIRYRFATGDPPDFREREDGTRQRLLDGCLPVVLSEWEDRGIAYSQEVFAALLHEPPWNEQKKRGDEPSVLLLRFTMRNTTPHARPARLWFLVEPGEYLAFDRGYARADGRYVPDHTVRPGWWKSPYDAPRLRAFIETNGRGDVHAAEHTAWERGAPSHPEAGGGGRGEIPPKCGALVYEVLLEGGERHAVEFKIPFETYTDPEDEEAVARLDYDRKRSEMVEYWTRLVEEGAQLDVPEELVRDFARAVLPHVAITVDKDVESGLYIVPAATYRYNVCSNEACMQIHMLDLLGHHERARAYLETFLKCQGTRPLHGRFKSREGVLHGLKVDEAFDYQTFNYNLDHGWIMHTCAEHVRLTGDREWLSRWAPNLVAAADFVARERRATMVEEGGEPVWEYGLLPAGHLEDNPEWFYWYTVNAYTWRGMQAVAEVLGGIGHPEAPRLLAEAEAYKKDILAAVRRSIARAPVVPLRDGTWVPHVPTRAYLRGRDLGWIRENLYGSMHLLVTGIIDPRSREADWILKDYEDNLFVNPAYGRFVDVEKDWFSQGGMTIQAHLMYLPLVYLRRDQIKHALRAYYNALASHLYPDVRCFTEHAVRELGTGVGPFYKTSDESGSVTWLRHFLVHEEGERLQLAWGVPRRWLEHGKTVLVQGAPTYFGPVSYTIESRSGDGAIEVRLLPPRRRAPSLIEVRARHPGGARPAGVRVEGAGSHRLVPEKECAVLADPGEEVRLVFFYHSGVS